MGTWLEMDGSSSTSLVYGADLNYGRTTVKSLLTTAVTSSYAGLTGPLLRDPHGKLVCARVGFALPVLSIPAGEGYYVHFGFNVGANPATDAVATVFIDDDGEIYFVCSDGVTPVVHDIGLTVAAQWYDMEIVFTATAINLYINGALADSVAVVISDSVNCTFTALRLDKTVGAAPSGALIDYTELYTRGHLPRPLS